MQKQIIISTILVFLCSSLAAIAQADNEESEEESSARNPGEVTSIDVINSGKSNGRALASAAEYCVQIEQYDKAIKLSRQALDKNYDDNEIHQVYAEALEGKLKEQANRDPALFNQCVQEWLIVLRQETGDEKGLTAHGIGIPMMGKLYEDDDRVIPARQHLLKLTGTTPKFWETDNKYLKRITTSGANKVYGKVVPRDAKTTQPVDEK
jgi:tetratricopeptide (TPR) repeat protein